jgi:hypothetical protein
MQPAAPAPRPPTPPPSPCPRPQAAAQGAAFAKGGTVGTGWDNVRSALSRFIPSAPRAPQEVAVPTVEWKPVTVMTPTLQVYKMGESLLSAAQRARPGRAAAGEARVSSRALNPRTGTSSRRPPRRPSPARRPGFCVPRAQWTIQQADAVDCPPQTYMQNQNGVMVW